MNTKTRFPISSPLAAVLLFVLSFAALLGSVLLASVVGGLPGVALAVAGFCGYIALFSWALRRLSIDWDSWREPDVQWRPRKPPAPRKNGEGTGLRIVATTIISAALVLPLVGAVATF